MLISLMVKKSTVKTWVRYLGKFLIFVFFLTSVIYSLYLDINPLVNFYYGISYLKNHKSILNLITLLDQLYFFSFIRGCMLISFATLALLWRQTTLIYKNPSPQIYILPPSRDGLDFINMYWPSIFYLLWRIQVFDILYARILYRKRGKNYFWDFIKIRSWPRVLPYLILGLPRLFFKVSQFIFIEVIFYRGKRIVPVKSYINDYIELWLLTAKTRRIYKIRGVWYVNGGTKPEFSSWKFFVKSIIGDNKKADVICEISSYILQQSTIGPHKFENVMIASNWSTTSHWALWNMRLNQWVMRTDAEKAFKNSYYKKTDLDIVSRNYEGPSKDSALLVYEPSSTDRLTYLPPTRAIYEVRGVIDGRIDSQLLSDPFLENCLTTHESLINFDHELDKLDLTSEDKTLLKQHFINELLQINPSPSNYKVWNEGRDWPPF